MNISTAVRIIEIKLNNFKNVQQGTIKMPSLISKNHFSKAADIIGIYGQNGSGKTSVVEAMQTIKHLLSGRSLPPETIHYISADTNVCSIAVKFALEINQNRSVAEYIVTLQRTKEHTLEITHEVLKNTDWANDKSTTQKVLFDYALHSKDTLFSPKYRLEELLAGDSKREIDLHVAKKIAAKELHSFIFANEGRHILTQSPNISSNYIINLLHEYAKTCLFVITGKHSGLISLNHTLAFVFRLHQDQQIIATGSLPIRLDAPSIISQSHYEVISKVITELNLVLSKIIPDLSIALHNWGTQLLENGEKGYKVELLSKRSNSQIPLHCESEGILKIISILHILVCTYASPSMCLIIDELDSGIFEYLLGELLTVFEKGAKGQLIFTAHNLRALEMLNKKSIIFSTANPQNRYIRMQNVKSNNNLRDMYLRSLVLGGQKEDIYMETDSIEIARAFRRAGEAGCKHG